MSYSLKAAPAAKIIATTAALEALNRHNAKNQIQRAFGTRDAYVLPTAPRAPWHGTRRRLDSLRIERAIGRLCGFHRHAISCPNLRVTAATRSTAQITIRATSFNRIRLNCGPGGALSSRISRNSRPVHTSLQSFEASPPNEIAFRNTRARV
jgi:hypothetical protein